MKVLYLADNVSHDPWLIGFEDCIADKSQNLSKSLNLIREQKIGGFATKAGTLMKGVGIVGAGTYIWDKLGDAGDLFWVVVGLLAVAGVALVFMVDSSCGNSISFVWPGAKPDYSGAVELFAPCN